MARTGLFSLSATAIDSDERGQQWISNSDADAHSPHQDSHGELPEIKRKEIHRRHFQRRLGFIPSEFRRVGSFVCILTG